MMANKFIKALAQSKQPSKNLEGFLDARSVRTGEWDFSWPQKLWLAWLTGEWHQAYEHFELSNGAFRRINEERGPCQFFEFGTIRWETLIEEAAPVWEGFTEGLVGLPAPSSFMEISIPTRRKEGETGPGGFRPFKLDTVNADSAFFAGGFGAEPDWQRIKLVESITYGYFFSEIDEDTLDAATIFNYPDFPSVFLWDGVILTLDKKKLGSRWDQTKLLGAGTSTLPFPVSCKLNLYNMTEGHLKNRSRHLFSVLMMMLGRLNAKGIEREKVAPPAKLNARRIKRGLPEMVTHTTVRIRPYRPALGRSGPHEGDPSTKRFHFRRGHVRRFQNGEQTWVRPCFVGTEEAGVVEHDYVVEPN